MPFKKPNNAKKNKTKKQQKKAASKSSDNNNDASSVEEIIVSEPIPPVAETPVEEVNVEEIVDWEAHEEYMRVNYYIPQYQEWRKRMDDALIADLSNPEYWEERREAYERSRERYNKKAAWSAQDILEIEEIDRQIADIDKTLDELYGIEPEPPRSPNPILGMWPVAEDGWVH